MQNNKKNYERAESEGAKKNKSYLIANNNLVRSHSFTAPAKKSKFRTPTSVFPSIHKHPILLQAHSTPGRP